MQSEYQCRYCYKIFKAYKGQNDKRCPNCNKRMGRFTAYRVDQLPEQNRDIPVIPPDKVTNIPRH